MKKVLNVLIGILLVGLIALSVILFIKNKELQEKYDELSIDFDNKSIEYETLTNNYNTLNADKNTLQTDYDTLENKYNTLQSDYNELKALYDAETAVTYETPTDLSQYATDITYDNLARTPDDYEGKDVCFTGEVVQLIDGEEETQIRLAIDGDYDKIILIGYDPSIVSERVLENDNITIYGVSMGIFTYESTLGGMISVPGVWVDHIQIN